MERNWNDISTHRIALEEYYSHARGKVQLWHSAVREYLEDYFLEQPVEDGESKRTDLKDIVDQMVNVLENARLQIKLTRPGNSFVDRNKAEAGEKYLAHVLDTIDQRHGGKVRTQLLHNMLSQSAGVLHWVYKPNPVAGLEDVVSPYHVPPVDMFVVDPLNFYPVLGGPLGQFQYVLHVENISVEEVMQMIDTTFRDSPSAMEQMTQWYITSMKSQNVYEREETKDTLINYWGWHNVGGQWVVFNAVKFGNAVLRPFTPMPGYKVLPWAVAVANDTGHKELHKRWLPVTYSAREHTRRLERLQNRIDLLTQKIADNPFLFYKSQESGTNPNVIADSDYMVTLEPGERLEAPDYKSLSPDFWRQLEQAQMQLERSSLPGTIFGGVGTETSASYSSSNEGGRLRFIRPADAVTFAYGQALRGIMAFVFALHANEPIYTTTLHKQNKQQNVVLTGSDLAPATWEIKVMLDAQLPGDETRNMTLATMGVGSGLFSKNTARERWLHVEDPMAEQEQIMLETVMASDPRIASAYGYKVLYEMDALPDLTGAEYMQIWGQIEAIKARGKFLGIPEPQIKQYVQRILLGLKAELHNRAMMTGGEAPAPRPNAPAVPQDPRLGGAMAPNGAIARQEAGFGAPGSGQDVGTPFRNLANTLNGSVGQRQ